ncbi:MAG: metallopeptidase TldD-related protein [Gammaproteobacteria bacterium]|nr:metallopeptidase TldD-related protein [Gammaproteobacteria bacterium]MDE0251878.1 metallopeptidase TldD-related protein [Gammaproteobacteria bacterium]
MKKFQLYVWLGIAFSAIVGFAQSNDNDVLLQALQDEMERSLIDLQLDEEPAPYFISYTVIDRNTTSIRATGGAKVAESSSRVRYLDVSVRVGDRVLDNTKYFAYGGSFGATNTLPLNDSYDELRRVIWQLTDQEYKSAISALSGKSSMLESQAEIVRPNDFNEEEAFIYESDEVVPSLDYQELHDLTLELSDVFTGNAELRENVTMGRVVTTERIYLDSDGNSHRVTANLCSIQSEASAQASDGRAVSDFSSTYAYDCADLPAKEILEQDHQVLIARVMELKDAETLDAYTGPAIFADQASAELIVQTIGRRVTAFPPGVNAYRGIQRQNNPFVERIGNRVFARFLGLINDPTLQEYEGVPLLGSYHVDIEGVPSRRTDLVIDGKLQTLLTTRNPIKGIDKSSGSNRRGQPMPGNLIVETSESMSQDELHDELLQLVDDEGYDYGLVIHRLANYSEMSLGNFFGGPGQGGGLIVTPTLQAYKVYPDGTEVAVLPMSFSSFVDKQLKDIVAVSADMHAYNISVGRGIGGGKSGIPLIGVVTPSLLLEEISLADTAGDKPKVPIVSHPLTESVSQ